MVADSTNVSEYTFGECRKNGAPIRLKTWKHRRVVNANTDLLSFNSRTVDFAMGAGDTISFFRELSWYDPVHYNQDSAGYYSLDTLTFAVELVRSSDSLRIALIDSIGIMPCPTHCTPIVHGTRPIIAHVKYITPSSLHGTMAFLRVRAYARGGGLYDFTRSDKYVVGLSRKLLDPYWQNYLAQWGQLLAKPAVDPAPTTGSQPKLTLSRTTGSTVAIQFTSSPDGGSTSIVIYDALGQVRFYPYSTPFGSGEQTTSFTFNESGLYLIGLLHNGKLVNHQKITITR